MEQSLPKQDTDNNNTLTLGFKGPIRRVYRLFTARPALLFNLCNYWLLLKVSKKNASLERKHRQGKGENTKGTPFVEFGHEFVPVLE